MRFAVWDHAGKGSYLHQQLLHAGHTTAPTVADADLLLLDCDWAWAHPRPSLIHAAAQTGAKIVLYPHGGQPTTYVYDGLTNPDPLVSLRLEHGTGAINAARELGLDLDQHATGWLYSPTQPFEPVEDPARILFAPQHPNMEMLLNGTNGHDPGPRANQHIYQWLIRSGFEVTVSVVGPLWRNGIYPHPNVSLVSNHQMRFEQTWDLLQDFDLVIAAGTVAAAAVAAGKPTIMLGQSHYADYVDGRYVQPDHPDIYDPLFRYPLDASDGDLDDLIVTACVGSPEVAEWRATHIGDDGAGLAVELLEELVGETSVSVVTMGTGMPEEIEARTDVFIEGVTATAAAAVGTDDDA